MWGISSLWRTKKIILWWNHVIVSVLWINKTKWTQRTTHCISISRLNALKNTHSVYMKPSLLEITFGKYTLGRLAEEVKVFLEETGRNVSNNQEWSFLHNFSQYENFLQSMHLTCIRSFDLYNIIPFYFHLMNYITIFWFSIIIINHRGRFYSTESWDSLFFHRAIQRITNID